MGVRRRTRKCKMPTGGGLDCYYSGEVIRSNVSGTVDMAVDYESCGAGVCPGELPIKVLRIICIIDMQENGHSIMVSEN